MRSNHTIRGRFRWARVPKRYMRVPSPYYVLIIRMGTRAQALNACALTVLFVVVSDGHTCLSVIYVCLAATIINVDATMCGFNRRACPGFLCACPTIHIIMFNYECFSWARMCTRT